MAEEEVELMASAPGAVAKTVKDDAASVPVVKATTGSIGEEQPLKNTVGSTWGDKYHQWKQQRYTLPRHYKLVSLFIAISLLRARRCLFRISYELG